MLAAPLPANNGYTWTLASRLGHMLVNAQELFGPRDMSYTILGVEFVCDTPRIWFPGNCSNIVVQLHEPAALDVFNCYYQLAHEVVHLLAPTGQNDGTNLEEGVACYFASHYMRTCLNRPSMLPNAPSYRRAQGLLQPRLDNDVHCIRRLRSKQPSFSRIAREDVVAEFPELNPAEIDFLISRFDRDA